MTEWDPFRVRNIPKTMDGFQAITFLIDNRCSAPAWMYFETVMPFVGTAIIRLLEFGALDIVRGYFRPVGLRSGRHFRRGKKGGRTPRGIPEIGESIARRLPYAQEMAGRRVTDGVRNLWMFDGILQNQLNNLLIADIIDDSLVGWAQLLRSEACNNIGGTSLVARDENFVVSGIHQWLADGTMTVIWPNPGLLVGSIQSFGPRGGFMSFSGGPVAILSGAPECQTRVTAGGGSNLSTPRMGTESNGNDMSASRGAPGNGTAIGEARANGGIAVFDVTMTVQYYD